MPSANLGEFLLKHVTDVRQFVQRARILASLAQLTPKQRRELEDAVQEVCRSITARGGSARVCFGLVQRQGRRFVEISVRDEQATGDDNATDDRGGERGEPPVKRATIGLLPYLPDVAFPADGIVEDSEEPAAETIAPERDPSTASGVEDPSSASGNRTGDTPPVTGHARRGEDDWLKRFGRILDHFEVSDRSLRGAVIRMGQAVSPAFRGPTDNEVRDWARMLHAHSAEDALAMALQQSRALLIQLGYARDREGLRTDLGRARMTADDLAVLSQVISKTMNAIAIMDDEGRVIRVNRAFTEMTGYTAAEAAGQRLDELLFGPSTQDDARRDFRDALEHGHELTLDVLLYRRDGKTIWSQSSLVPLLDGEGQVTRWIAIETDVTKRIQTEQALRQAKEDAEAHSRAKSEFLANISHEIRTPMNAIIGMTELALNTELTGEQRDFLKTVQNSAESLLQLLNDVLDLSKIEAGKLVIEEIEFPIAQVVRETLQTMAVKAHQKGLELAARVPMDLPDYVRGDPTRLRQILFNLVGNAIKFTERGEVVVEVEEEWRTDREIGLHFSVQDTGIGIPSAKRDRIFEAFAQADASTTRQYGGTGLGLAITSELVRLMRGRIWLESEGGKGSTFHFSLPVLRSDRRAVDPTAERDPKRLRGLRVLVVDDNRTNRRILEGMLQHWEMRPTLADGADAALAELEEAVAREDPFDLVVLDALMPEVDGFDFAEKVRERPELKCGTIMMLSSAGRPDTQDRFGELGIDRYLVKPVSSGALLDAILEALPPEDAGVRGSPAAEPPPTQPPALRPLRVLVADDHEANRQLVTTVLSRRGHACVEVGDGKEALDAIGREPFDVILMDVQMPEMDGLEAASIIRMEERESGTHVPMIALTAHAMAGDRERCLAAGMDAYLAKPLRPRDLVTLVEQLAGTRDDDPARTLAEAATMQSREFDLDAALESMDGDQDLLLQQMAFLRNDAPELLAGMREAVRNEDARALEIAAHRLKGLVSRYTFEEAARLALQLEAAGREGRLGEVEPLLDQLEPRVERLLKAVDDYSDRYGGAAS